MVNFKKIQGNENIFHYYSGKPRNINTLWKSKENSIAASFYIFLHKYSKKNFGGEL
jgi:hypothetical protein